MTGRGEIMGRGVIHEEWEEDKSGMNECGGLVEEGRVNEAYAGRMETEMNVVR